MKNKIIYVICIMVIVLGIFVSSSKINDTYSYGLIRSISGSDGSYKITYIDASTDYELSFDDAYNYYGVKKYETLYKNGGQLYFYKGNQISETEYLKGSSIEDADDRYSEYSSGAYRVHTTSEFKNAIDDVYKNLKIGEFHIIFSNYEDIDLNEVVSYYDQTYGLVSAYQNYYTYSIKGEFEPHRFSVNAEYIKEDEELVINGYEIRISGNEKKVLENFVNNLLPYLYQNGTDEEKIVAAYTYIVNTTNYLSDDGYVNDMLASNTSAYDALISKNTTCIGYSIAFSYLMDKLGIESYIVDNLANVNTTYETYTSTHTWNIVKLNGKFYKVDLTGKILLGGLSSSELYDSSKTISTTAYSYKSVSIDYDAIAKILSSAKSISTTTTKVVEANTTTKTVPYTKSGGSYTKYTNSTETVDVGDDSTTTSYTNNSNNSNTTSTETSDYTSETTTEIVTEVVTNEAGEVIGIKEVTTEHTSDNNSSTTSSSTNESSSPNETNTTNTKLKINLNYILFPLLFILIFLLIFYKVKDIKKKNINSKEVQDILNMDIKERKEKDNQNKGDTN